MNLLFYLGHPAHFHLFKLPILEFKSRGHNVKICIKSKDMLEELCVKSDFKFENILPEGRSNTSLSIGWSLIKRDYRLLLRALKFKPDLIIGAPSDIGHVGRLANIPTIVYNDDDISVVPYAAKFGWPFVSVLVCPTACNMGKYSSKTCFYHGYQKLSYLHPNHFLPNRHHIRHLSNSGSEYIILRFVGLTAHHDKGIYGFDINFAGQLIDLLSSKVKVFISSEKPLPSAFEKYTLTIEPDKIHHALYYAKFFVGDSQSMALESALLGTPSVRFSSFAGKIGVLEELEKKYQLTYAFPPNDKYSLIELVKRWIKEPDLKRQWSERRQIMLKDVIDLSAFSVWFIENYPNSYKIIKSNPEYQNRFQ